MRLSAGSEIPSGVYIEDERSGIRSSQMRLVSFRVGKQCCFVAFQDSRFKIFLMNFSDEFFTSFCLNVGRITNS